MGLTQGRRSRSARRSIERNAENVALEVGRRNTLSACAARQVVVARRSGYPPRWSSRNTGIVQQKAAQSRRTKRANAKGAQNVPSTTAPATMRPARLFGERRHAGASRTIRALAGKALLHPGSPRRRDLRAQNPGPHAGVRRREPGRPPASPAQERSFPRALPAPRRCASNPSSSPNGPSKAADNRQCSHYIQQRGPRGGRVRPRYRVRNSPVRSGSGGYNRVTLRPEPGHTTPRAGAAAPAPLPTHCPLPASGSCRPRAHLPPAAPALLPSSRQTRRGRRWPRGCAPPELRP